MPELPEVESARTVIERAALHRVITDVDDSDSYVCRPHRPGEIRPRCSAGRLTAAHRRGKSMWCDTSGTGPARRRRRARPSASISACPARSSSPTARATRSTAATTGNAAGPRATTGSRGFRLTFADGGALLLVDPRRLGRVRLDPPVEALGPDARRSRPAQFRAALRRGTAPVKARLLDQEVIAGIGNLLADQILWQAKISPARPVGELTRPETDRLLRALRRTVDAALDGGGVHTLTVIPFRRAEAACPRCGTPMAHGTVGGRTTWWCPREQT